MNYSVVPYQDRYQVDVIRMLGAFWNYHPELAEDFFKWKYLDNPFTQTVNIALLLSGSDVVGMRGAGILPLGMQGAKKLAACVGDSWIDVDHRGNNQFGSLSSCLEKMIYANNCNLILNMSASEKVRASSLKNGWTQIAESKTLSVLRSNNPEFSTDFKHVDQQFGQPQAFEDGTLISSNQLFVESVANLQKAVPSQNRYDIDRSSAYLRWRYLRPGANYRFLYLFEKMAAHSNALPPLRSFVSLCIPSQHKPGHLWVSDYLCKELLTMSPILSTLVEKLDFRSINIQDTVELEPLKKSLARSGFEIDLSNAKPQFVLELGRQGKAALEAHTPSQANILGATTFCHRAINLDSA